MTSRREEKRLLRAWRTRLRASFVKSTILEITRPTPLRHCGEVSVQLRGPLDASVVTSRLGELLRVVALTAARPHVDPSVFNALWENDGLCPMGAALCARCDALDRSQKPVVHLAIQGDRTGARSGLGLIHDAIYNWDEATDACAEYIQLREAFRSDDEHKLLPVELVLLIGLFPDDGELQGRELEALLARNGTEQSSFHITRALLRGRWAETTLPQYASLCTTIATAAGVSTDLEPVLWRPLEGTPSHWQWLFDWAKRTAGLLLVDRVAIVYVGHMTIDTLIQLVNIVATRCGPLDHLMLSWPLHLVRDDAAQRRRALETVGAVLFAPDSRVHIQTLAIDLGALTEEDVAALHRGSRGTEARTSSHDVEPRIHSVEWNSQTTTEAIICQVVPLFASVDVRELEICVDPSRSLSCRTLKTVLSSCPQLTKLTWWMLACDDFTELADDSTWASQKASQLRTLRLMGSQGDNADVVAAVDALMAHIGCQLTSLALFTSQSAFSGPLADVLVARCPQLRDLEVGYADAPFHDRLVHALDDGRCGITNFVTRSGPAGRGSEWAALFNALKNPRAGASRTLRQVTVDAWQVQSASQKAVIHAFCEAVSTSAMLQRAVFIGDLRDANKAQFRALPRPFVSRLPSMRRRLALLSVSGATSDQRLAKLPPDVLGTIFEFSGRPTRRYAY